MATPTILIADDEDDLRDLWHMFLVNEIEANYIFAAHGEQAIEILKTNHIDVIICDYRMPHRNGGDVFIFNVKDKNVPFILVSGGYIDDYPEFKLFTEVNPCNRFMSKPVLQSDLVTTVKLALEKRGLK